MAQTIEWRANTAGNPTYYTTAGWGNLSCGRGCWGGAGVCLFHLLEMP